MLKTALISLAAAAAIAVPAAYAEVPTVGPVSQVNITIAPALSAKTKDFAARDFEILEQDLRRAVERQLTRKGVFGPQAGGTLDLVIEDAKETRPTFRQLTEKPGLSVQSFGLGGIKLSGTYRAPNGTESPISYDWYESDIRQASQGWTWQAASDGIARFAVRLTKS